MTIYMNSYLTTCQLHLIDISGCKQKTIKIEITRSWNILLRNINFIFGVSFIYNRYLWCDKVVYLTPAYSNYCVSELKKITHLRLSNFFKVWFILMYLIPHLGYVMSWIISKNILQFCVQWIIASYKPFVKIT